MKNQFKEKGSFLSELRIFVLSSKAVHGPASTYFHSLSFMIQVNYKISSVTGELEPLDILQFFTPFELLKLIQEKRLRWRLSNSDDYRVTLAF